MKIFSSTVTRSKIDPLVFYFNDWLDGILRILQRQGHRHSKPFISGDTFRSISDAVLDNLDAESLGLAERNLLANVSIGAQRRVLFVDLKCLIDEKAQKNFLDWSRKIRPYVPSETSFVFHNGDNVPVQIFFSELFAIGFRSFSTNVIKPQSGVTSIPIGIENRRLGTNGILRYFLKSSKSVTFLPTSRPIDIYAAFNIATNPKERQLAANAIVENGHTMVSSRVHPRDYRSALSKALFVISPPGNGFDCHRTWEAIYFGAIPIVKTGTLAEELYKDSPIIVVDEWEEICSLNRVQLEGLYVSLINRPKTIAYFDYWERLIKS